MDDKQYLEMKKESTVYVKKKGRMVARYKPGTTIQDSRKGTYRVLEDGSWIRVGK